MGEAAGLWRAGIGLGDLELVAGIGHFPAFPGTETLSITYKTGMTREVGATAIQPCAPSPLDTGLRRYDDCATGTFVGSG